MDKKYSLKEKDIPLEDDLELSLFLRFADPSITLSILKHIEDEKRRRKLIASITGSPDRTEYEDLLKVLIPYMPAEDAAKNLNKIHDEHPNRFQDILNHTILETDITTLLSIFDLIDLMSFNEVTYSVVELRLPEMSYNEGLNALSRFPEMSYNEGLNALSRFPNYVMSDHIRRGNFEIYYDLLQKPQDTPLHSYKIHVDYLLNHGVCLRILENMHNRPFLVKMFRTMTRDFLETNRNILREFEVTNELIETVDDIFRTGDEERRELVVDFLRNSIQHRITNDADEIIPRIREINPDIANLLE